MSVYEENKSLYLFRDGQNGRRIWRAQSKQTGRGVAWQKQGTISKGGSDAGKISVSGNSNNETTTRVEDVRRQTVNWLCYLIRHPSVNSKTKDVFWHVNYRSDKNYSAIENLLLDGINTWSAMEYFG